MKLRTMAVIALALVAGSAQAQDAGWDTKAGIIFGIGIDGAPLADYAGNVGLQYNLGPQAALRVGLNLQRGSCGDTEIKAGTVTTTDVCTALGGYNSTLDFGLSAEYLMRSSTAAVSPYFGGGLFFDIGTASLKGTDKTDVAGAASTEYANSSSTLGFGLLGKAGVEWRVNKVIGLFAEYQLGISLVNRTSDKTEVTNNPGGGGVATVSKSESKRTDVLNLGTGVSNGGLVGIVAFF